MSDPYAVAGFLLLGLFAAVVVVLVGLAIALGLAIGTVLS